jgi:hypothetical protein
VFWSLFIVIVFERITKKANKIKRDKRREMTRDYHGSLRASPIPSLLKDFHYNHTYYND